MKLIKYLLIAFVATTMVSCGDDEPKNTYTRDFTMIYPQFAPGHKQISKIEQEDTKGNKIVATASYDGEHLKSVNVVTKYSTGGGNEETITFDYKNGAIICDKSIQDVTYAIEVNPLGAFTRLVCMGGHSRRDLHDRRQARKILHKLRRKAIGNHSGGRSPLERLDSQRTGL